MNFITSTLNENTMLIYYLHTLIVYEIKTEDVYEDFYKNKSLFDFSDYQKIQIFLILSIKK